MYAPVQVPFEAGSKLRLARPDDAGDAAFVLRGENRDLGRVALQSAVAAALLTVGERGWMIETWGRGWRLAALDHRGEAVKADPPAGCDRELLAGFVATALLLHRAFRPPTRREPRWTGDGGFFGGGDCGGGGGDGGGGGC